MNNAFNRLARFRHLPTNALSAFKILRDPRVASWQKGLFGLLAGSYLIWPTDLIVDLPFFGHLDDLGVFILLLGLFMSQVSDHIKEEHGWREL